MRKMEETAPGGIPLGSEGRWAGSTSGLRGFLEIISANPSHCLKVSLSLRPRQGKGLAQGHLAGDVMELGWNRGLRSAYGVYTVWTL